MKDKRLINSTKSRKKSYSPDVKIVRIRTEHNGVSLFKGAIALGSVFLQLGIILSLNIFFAAGLRWYLILCYVLSIVTSVYVISSKRSLETKAIWVLFITVAFMIGFVVFWLSEDSVVYGRARKRHGRIVERSNAFVSPYAIPDLNKTVKADTQFLYNTGKFLSYTNSGIEYFPSGAQFFDSILEELEKAEKFIFIEFFIISDGILLDRVWNIIERKLSIGVNVRIIYDDVGASRLMSLKTRNRLKKSGAEVEIFNKLFARFSFAMNYRDHRKIIVIDGKVGYSGGCNLSDEYINEKRMYGYWKDVGVKITGLAVDGLTLTFLRQWEFLVKKELDYSTYLRLGDRIKSDFLVVPYAGGPDLESPICKGIYASVIAQANKFIYVYTPYFIPDVCIVEALKNKALSGVDVRIVLPDIPDKRYVYVLTLDYAEKLIPFGVKIFKMTDSFVHAKGILTENCAIIGSANFDMRSFYQQFENGIYTNDKAFMENLYADFEDVFSESHQVEKPTRHSFLYRIMRGILRIVSPLM